MYFEVTNFVQNFINYVVKRETLFEPTNELNRNLFLELSSEKEECKFLSSIYSTPSPRWLNFDVSCEFYPRKYLALWP